MDPTHIAHRATTEPAGTAEGPLTTGAAARSLGRSETTIRKMHARGILPGVRTSAGHRLFARADVDALSARLKDAR